MKSEKETNFEEITKHWGFSTTALKEYLNKYYKEDIDYAEKLGDININYILPYRNNGFFYGKIALERLELAMQAKAIIMGAIGDLEYEKYAYECLRLFLKINSMIKIGSYVMPAISYKNFEKLVHDTYWSYMSISDNIDEFDKHIRHIEDICEKYRPKRKKTKYHYSEEDFKGMEIIIKLEEYNRLKKAYEYWVEEIYEKQICYKANKEGLDKPVKLTYKAWSNYMNKYGITKQKHKK